MIINQIQDRKKDLFATFGESKVYMKIKADKTGINILVQKKYVIISWKLTVQIIHY